MKTAHCDIAKRTVAPKFLLFLFCGCLGSKRKSVSDDLILPIDRSISKLFSTSSCCAAFHFRATARHSSVLCTANVLRSKSVYAQEWLHTQEQQSAGWTFEDWNIYLTEGTDKIRFEYCLGKRYRINLTHEISRRSFRRSAN